MGARHPLHVLFVARWYPSHDQPGRGTFVADLATALEATGAVTVTVASFEATHVRGVIDTRPERARGAEAAIAGVLGADAATHHPRSWGAPGVPVGRLPAFLDGDRRRPGDVVDAHAAPLLAFARGLESRRPIDVIHAHTGLPDGVAASRVADALDLPLLTTEHASTTADELVEPEARDLYRRLLKPPRQLVAVSRALAHDIGRSLGIADEAIPVVPNAVPLDRFPPGDLGQRDPNELLYVGSRKASKGIEPLLRAFTDVRSRRPDLRLRLIGGPGQPADEARWRSLAGELGVEAAVTFEDPAPRAEVAEAMRRAALFVHPSPHETFGMVAAEALAAGLPVAATPSGGVDEIVGRDGRFGAIAGSITAPALAEAIERALAAAARMDRPAMRAHVEARYAASAVARRTIELYEGLIARHGRTALRHAAGSSAQTSGQAGSRLERPLVVALARGQAIDRVSLLPPALRERLTIVTSPRGRYADDRDLPDWGNWLELDPDAFYRDALQSLEQSRRPAVGLGRLKVALRGPNPARERRDLATRRDEIRREGIEQFLRDAIASVSGGSGGGAHNAPVWIVALDADDVLLGERVGDAAARLAPGGLRWLVDGWDESGRSD